MMITNEIQFHREENVFELQLRGRVTTIEGDTGSGKSFFVNNLETLLSSFRGTVHTQDQGYFDCIEIFSQKKVNPIESILNLRDKLIIVDDADLLLDNKEIVDYINNDLNNQYVLIGRVVTCRVPLCCRATIEVETIEEERRFSLQYNFEVDGKDQIITRFKNMAKPEPLKKRQTRKHGRNLHR